jgi:hypothetical protein
MQAYAFYVTITFLACDATKNGVESDIPTDGQSFKDARGGGGGGCQACRTCNRRDYMNTVIRLALS